MYKIIGGDGKEYGPVTTEQLRQWLVQGRANAHTKLLPEGASEWISLAECAEFAGELKSSPAAGTSPPPLGATAPPAKTSGLAIASLVLGVCGLISCGVTSLVGLVLGIVALVKINKSQGKQSGSGLAIAGIAVSGLFLLIIPIYAAMLLPALAKAKQKAQTINCVNNLKQLGLAIRIYASDNKDQLPAATNWCDAILTDAGTDKIFKCPDADASQRCHYAYNAKLANAEDGKVDPQTVMIFETDGGWNVSGGRELMLKRSRHGRTFNVVFADGSVQQISESRVATLRWDP
jgi:prepilin-type processing-associated H-X9-DG protein